MELQEKIYAAAAYLKERLGGRKPLAGSCGGLAAKLGINHTCTCGREGGCCNAELPPLKEPPADAT